MSIDVMMIGGPKHDWVERIDWSLDETWMPVPPKRIEVRSHPEGRLLGTYYLAPFLSEGRPKYHWRPSDDAMTADKKADEQAQ